MLLKGEGLGAGDPNGLEVVDKVPKPPEDDTVADAPNVVLLAPPKGEVELPKGACNALPKVAVWVEALLESELGASENGDDDDQVGADGLAAEPENGEGEGAGAPKGDGASGGFWPPKGVVSVVAGVEFTFTDAEAAATLDCRGFSALYLWASLEKSSASRP